MITVRNKCFRERYRDLIEAADTIKDMKNSAENVRIIGLISRFIIVETF